jgi:hypothetical protein
MDAPANAGRWAFQIACLTMMIAISVIAGGLLRPATAAVRADVTVGSPSVAPASAPTPAWSADSDDYGLPWG